MNDLLLLLQDATTVRWYDSPTGFAALVALFGVLAAPLINQWIKNRTATKDKFGHLSEAALNINRDERKEAVELLKASHANTVATLERQMREQDLQTDRIIIESKVIEYEARQRAHMYGNECNRVVAMLYRRDALLSQHNIEATPPFIYKTYPEIMAGLDEMVIQYRKQLEEEIATRRREEDERLSQTRKVE